MLPPHDLLPVIAILTIFVFLPALVLYGVIRIKREAREARENASAFSIRELEERIQRAVEAANEPLRRQLVDLERKLDVVERVQQLPESEEAERHLLPPGA